MKKLVIGILAHVDAGKTTLTEGLLYQTGKLRKLGRVDHGDAFLDTHSLEQARGITIFSKQAGFSLGELEITILDTPGHTDFSAETERTLPVLDYVILVISGTDGVQAHTRTLWNLLELYHIPVFLFINKMDRDGTKKEAILQELKTELSNSCIDFSERSEAFYESLAVCREDLLEQYLAGISISNPQIQSLVAGREAFPCFFGSALRMEGITELLQGMASFMRAPDYPVEFGAYVYKITRDEQGNRLTHMKITGGSIKPKATLIHREPASPDASDMNSVGTGKQMKNAADSSAMNSAGTGKKIQTSPETSYMNSAEVEKQEEKINQIRIYAGAKYEAVNEAAAGTVCAVTGLELSYPGESFGVGKSSRPPVLEPVLSCRLELPEGMEPSVLLPKLRQLEEENPELRIFWHERLQEIQLRIMGEIQTEILQSLIQERFGIEVGFGPENVLYKETINSRVEGVGHFEPLRHYAEVHLRMEPGKRGSGVVIVADCSEDELEKNWQRLILTHLQEKEHHGVLTGAPLTDVRITLVAGRAHKKHTEGGDFRQATYRAVRQGLMQAESLLLEPYYDFRLELPNEFLGRALSDIDKLYGKADAPLLRENLAVLTGFAPVSTFRAYAKEVIAYTRGKGKLTTSVRGYEICHNAAEVIAKAGYIAERDVANPSASVFCAHGSGFLVEWDRVFDFMHLECENTVRKASNTDVESDKISKNEKRSEGFVSTEEVDAILERTAFANRRGKDERRQGIPRKVELPAEPRIIRKKAEKKEEYLLVDGYNIIFAWEELRELAKVSIDGARGRLLDILCNYQGMKKCNLIAVFDAYRVQGHTTERIAFHNINVVFTREAETADQYIESFAHRHGGSYDITVATSDHLEQMIIYGAGCRLLSAEDFLISIRQMEERLREEFL